MRPTSSHESEWPESWWIREAVAGDPYGPADLLEQLSRDSDPHVRIVAPAAGERLRGHRAGRCGGRRGEFGAVRGCPAGPDQPDQGGQGQSPHPARSEHCWPGGPGERGARPVGGGVGCEADRREARLLGVDRQGHRARCRRTARPPQPHPGRRPHAVYRRAPSRRALQCRCLDARSGKRHCELPLS
ncbi:hypothetical protein [Saccharothrix sp. ST-888]|uniref:hypothetical protein n=1 Tax=Saccharothrix sp. ST-888 TaxID=1427391 RepID=UPI003FA76EFE